MKLSIIVPVYNVEEYIDDCLQSLLNQGFQEDEFEIICIDDGSTDKSGEIIKTTASKYPAVKAIVQNNRGVSAARNTGLLSAHGEYICFVDADDLVAGKALSKVVALMHTYKAESCSFNFDEFGNDGGFHNEDSPTSLNATLGGKPLYAGNVWRFVFSKDLLINNNIRFNENMTYAEDELFVYHVCCNIDFKNHLFINDVIYHYRLRSTSLVHQNKMKRISSHQDAMIIMAREYKKLLDSNAVPEHMLHTTRERLKYAVSNALFDNLYLGNDPDYILKRIKELDLYPYGFQVELLHWKKSKKTMLVNYSKFLFSCEWYYKLFCKTVGKKLSV